MGWEPRGSYQYYIRRQTVHGRRVRTSLGRGAVALAAATVDAARRQSQERARTTRAQLTTLDRQSDAVWHRITQLMQATLLVAGYHQHHRSEWRQRMHTTRDGLNDTPQRTAGTETSVAQAPVQRPSVTELETLLQRGMQGDRAVLPALRALLETDPRLWQDVRSVVTEVEQAWMQLLTGENLVTREIYLRQLQALKATLAGPTPTPLEQLLVERIALCWLQVQQADGLAAQHVSQRTAWVEQRQDRAQARLLAAIKALAPVRKLLRPGALVQVNIAEQQVNMG